MPIEIGDKSIVVFHPKNQLLDLPGVFDREPVSQVNRSRLLMQLVLEIKLPAEMIFVTPGGFETGAAAALSPTGIIKSRLHPFTVRLRIGWHPAGPLGFGTEYRGADGTGTPCVEDSRQLGYFRPACLIISPLQLEALFPVRVEINNGAFVEGSVLLAEATAEQGLPVGFHMRIDPQVLSVHRDIGVGTAGSG